MHRFVVIGLVSCSILLYEILLTRICALRFYHHFAFLVVSNCLLGLGASGTLIALFQAPLRRAARDWVFRFTALFVVTIVGSYALMLRVPVPTELDYSRLPHLLVLSAFNLLAAVPFFVGGTVVGMLLSFHPREVNRLYAVDLIGAGLGCLLCPLLLAQFGAGGVITVSALLAVLAVGACAPRGSRVVGGAVLLLGVLALAILPSVDERFPVPNKGMYDLSQGEEHVARREHSAWTTNSRIDLVAFGDWWEPRIYGLGSPTDELPPIPEQMHILQDADASTIICNFSEHPEALPLLEHSLYSTALQLKDRPRVFIIGAGGGNDVWAAMLRDASVIKAVELNRPIVDIHRERLPHFSRALLDDPAVELVVAEGRSAIMRDPGDYDVIQMTGIDTWTALASGAYVLAENYLYTQEAIESFYDHLAEDGILQIVRYSADMEALRLFSNVHAAFESRSVPHFAESVIAVRTAGQLMASLVKRGTFTDEEIEQVTRFAETNGMEVVYAPGRDVRGFVPAFIRAADKQAFIDAFPRNISPTTDDRPYFFNFTRWSKPLASRKFLEEPTCVSQGNPFFLLVQLGVSATLCVLLVLLPTRRLGGFRGTGAGRFLVYFSGLGLGFIAIEIAAMQKLTLFLGQPVYSITVTLFSMLVFSGLGSLLLAGRIGTSSRRVWLVPLGLAAFVAAFLLLSPWLVHSFIGAALGVRIALAVGLLAPIGVLLGVPFAYGIRILDERNPSLIPWAWSINGCLSVMGSILTVVISMNLGFQAVLCSAVVVYAIAFWALRRQVTAGAAAR